MLFPFPVSRSVSAQSIAYHLFHHPCLRKAIALQFSPTYPYRVSSSTLRFPSMPYPCPRKPAVPRIPPSQRRRKRRGRQQRRQIHGRKDVPSARADRQRRRRVAVWARDGVGAGGEERRPDGGFALEGGGDGLLRS